MNPVHSPRPGSTIFRAVRLLFVALFCVGIVGHLSPAWADLNYFNGVWANTKPSNKGITAIKINVSGTNVTMQAWEKCSSGSCDWGQIVAAPFAPYERSNLARDANIVSGIFAPGYASIVVIVSKIQSNMIKADVYTMFTDGSGRANYKTAYTFRKQAGGGPAAATGNCTAYDWRQVEAKFLNNRWKVVQGTNWLLDYGADRNGAIAAANTIRHYRMDNICFIGKPNPSLSYFLSAGQAPRGGMPGEYCIPFNLSRLQVKFVGNSWKLGDGAQWLLDFGPKQNDAIQAYNTIKGYGFMNICYVGSSMIYFRK